MFECLLDKDRQIASLKNYLVYILFVLLISFFSLFLWVTEENRTKMKKLFLCTTKLGETQNRKVRNIQTTLGFLSATVAMLVIF